MAALASHAPDSMDCDDHELQSDQFDSTIANMDITPIKSKIVSLSPSFSLQPTKQEQSSPLIWKQPSTDVNTPGLLTKEDKDDIHALSLPTPLPPSLNIENKNASTMQSNVSPPHADADISQTAQPQVAALTCSEHGSEDSSPNVDAASLMQKLAWVEASRDEMARQQGQYKGTIAKLEGAVASGERRLMQQASEIEALKAQQRQLQTELSATKIQANVTPERCRSSLRSLLDESLRFQASAQVNEVAVRKLREMCDYEAREQESLHDFLNIERSTLLEQVAKLSQDLASSNQQRLDQQVALEAANAECKRIGKSFQALSSDVESLKAELYYSKEKEVELSAEVTFLSEEASGTKAALEASQTECDQLRSELSKSQEDLKESKEVGGKIYKQMKAALRALEKHQGTLVKLAPDAAALIKSLADWMSNQSSSL